MKGIKLKHHLIEVGLDEREDVQINVSSLDKQGNVTATMPLSVKNAEDVAYTMLKLTYKVKNNIKLPEVK